jgi:lysophospholipase L1-like esterase
VLFVGSSSVRLWCTLDRDFPTLRVVNRGFGGSTMAEVVRHAPRIVLPLRPRTIVVYAGDNDLAEGRTPADVREAYRRFAALVHARLPGTRLVYLAVKPSPARTALLGAVRATNALLRDDARRDTLATYVDVHTPMLGTDGRPRAELFGADGLHMNAAGYALWHAALAPALAADGGAPGGAPLRGRGRGAAAGSPRRSGLRG